MNLLMVMYTELPVTILSEHSFIVINRCFMHFRIVRDYSMPYAF